MNFCKARIKAYFRRRRGFLLFFRWIMTNLLKVWKSHLQKLKIQSGLQPRMLFESGFRFVAQPWCMKFLLLLCKVFEELQENLQFFLFALLFLNKNRTSRDFCFQGRQKVDFFFLSFLYIKKRERKVRKMWKVFFLQ